MKIIDLLNKTTNGEEVPKKIKYKGFIYEYEDYDYFCSDIGYLFDKYNVSGILNDEIEILEEEKKIPEKLSILQFSDLIDMSKEKLIETIKEQRFKVNEIIDYLDYLKSKGDE